MSTATPISALVHLFTDGACRGNPGPGGWAYILKHPASGKSKHASGGEHHTTNNVPVTDAALAQRLKDMAIAIYRAFDAESYARIDIRSNQAGQIFFLEINCECSIFYPEGSEGSADYILKHEPLGHTGFLQLIIADGIRRHQERNRQQDR